jgi:hypothetical protein
MKAEYIEGRKARENFEKATAQRNESETTTSWGLVSETDTHLRLFWGA